MSSPAWTDGTWTAAYAVSKPDFQSPIPNDSERYVFTQDYMQTGATWTKLDLNTAHVDFPDFVLVSEGPRQNEGGDVIKWTRTYAKKPPTWDEVSGSLSYRFIGYGGFFFTGSDVPLPSTVGRHPFSDVVPVKIVRDYFLVGAGGDYSTSEDIPSIAQFFPAYDIEPGLGVDYIVNSPPFSFATIPTRDDYELMVADKVWLVAEASRIDRWMGNIFCRETRYVQAK